MPEVDDKFQVRKATVDNMDRSVTIVICTHAREYSGVVYPLCKIYAETELGTDHS